MARMTYNEYLPYYVLPPGETLLEAMENLGISRLRVAKNIGFPLNMIDDLIKGQAPLTPDIAMQLEKFFWPSANLWNNLERHYRKSLERQKEEGPFENLVGWLSEIPGQELIDKGWIEEEDDEEDQLHEVLIFFGVVSPGEWRKLWENSPTAEFCQRTGNDLVAVAAWLRQGEMESKDIDCQSYDAQTFRETLQEIRSLTRAPLTNVWDEVVSLCAEAGVAVGLVPTLEKMSVCSATRWLHQSRVLLQLASGESHQLLPTESLWRRFFHAAGHILLHRQNEMFCKCEGQGNRSQREQQATEFAASMQNPNGNKSKVFSDRLKSVELPIS